MTIGCYEGYMGQGMSMMSILEIIDSFPTTEKEINTALNEVNSKYLTIDFTEKIMESLKNERPNKGIEN